MRITFLAGIFLLLLSCSHSGERLLPSGLAQDSIIPRDRMVSLLTDIHLLEAVLQFDRNRKTNTPGQTVAAYNKLYSKYGISAKRFRLNLLYYQNDRQEFLKMYNEVLRNIETRQDDVKKKT
jgi:hypothetical protein